MDNFESHSAACDFARSYFLEKFPKYQLKFQTNQHNKDNIRIYLVDNWLLSPGFENVPLGWIYNTGDGRFKIAIEASLEKYLGSSTALTEVRHDFEQSTIQYEEILKEDEKIYYTSLLNSVRRDKYDTLPCLVQQEQKTSRTMNFEELDSDLVQAANAVFVRGHGNKYEWGAYMKKLPNTIQVYPLRKRNGKFSGKFASRLPAFSKDGNGSIEEKFSLPGRYERNPLVFSTEQSLDSSSLSTMARAYHEVEIDRRKHAHFPLDSSHPKFDSLSPTTQKLLILREKKQKRR